MQVLGTSTVGTKCTRRLPRSEEYRRSRLRELHASSVSAPRQIVLCIVSQAKDAMRPMPCDTPLKQPSFKLNSLLRQISSSNLFQLRAKERAATTANQTGEVRRAGKELSLSEQAPAGRSISSGITCNQPTNPTTYRYKSLGKNEVRKQ